MLAVIHENDDFLDVGILGARVLFHVLAAHGEAALAYKMITRPEWPSYGHFIRQGLTALSEEFIRDDGKWDSRNHHMFGDISNWFISRLAGLQYNPDADDRHNLIVSPAFIRDVPEADASFSVRSLGNISVRWKRQGSTIGLKATFPQTMRVEMQINPQREGESLYFYSGIPQITEENGMTRLSVSLTEICLREMSAADRAAVQRFYSTLGESSAAYFNVNRGNELRTMAFFDTGKPDHRFFVADAGGVVAAVAFIWDVDRQIPWFGICVHDDFQRKGLGTAVLRYVKEYCADKGYGGLLLRTALTNLPAQALYQANGFEQIGTHPSGELLYLLRFHRE